MVFAKENNMNKEASALKLQVNECSKAINNFDDAILFSSDESSSIASHFRHIVEFFNCFFDGVSSANIDYDNRKRDKKLENDREFLLSNIKELNIKIDSLSMINPDERVLVYESIDDKSKIACFSSFSREAIFLLSHTIHHLGIIKLLAEAKGLKLEKDFGKAQSTINYEKSAA